MEASVLNYDHVSIALFSFSLRNVIHISAICIYIYIEIVQINVNILYILKCICTNIVSYIYKLYIYIQMDVSIVFISIFVYKCINKGWLRVYARRTVGALKAGCNAILHLTLARVFGWQHKLPLIGLVPQQIQS